MIHDICLVCGVREWTVKKETGKFSRWDSVMIGNGFHLLSMGCAQIFNFWAL
jgi:hypothetical protein